MKKASVNSVKLIRAIVPDTVHAWQRRSGAVVAESVTASQVWFARKARRLFWPRSILPPFAGPLFASRSSLAISDHSGASLADWPGMVETDLFAQTYKSYGLPTVRYTVLEVTATVEPFENGRGLSLRVLLAGRPRTRIG